MADAHLVFRILTDADVYLVVIDNRRGDEVATSAPAAQLVDGILGIAVELPDEFPCLRVEGMQPAIAAGKDDLRLTVHFPKSRTGPLAMHEQQAAIHEVLEADRSFGLAFATLDQVHARRIVAPGYLTRVLVENQETRRFRIGDVDVSLIDAIARDNEELIADHQGRGAGEIMRENAQLLHHVELPD